MTDLYVHNNNYNIKDSHKEYTIDNNESEPDSNDEQCIATTVCEFYNTIVQLRLRL